MKKGERRQMVLDAINRNPRASYRELAISAGMNPANPSVVIYHIERLIKDGKIWRDDGLARSLHVGKRPGGKKITQVDGHRMDGRKITKLRRTFIPQKGRRSGAFVGQTPREDRVVKAKKDLERAVKFALENNAKALNMNDHDVVRVDTFRLRFSGAVKVG